MMKKMLPWLALLLGACASLNPPRDTSTRERIGEALAQAATPRDKAPQAVPEAVTASLLPPLRPGLPKLSGRRLEQRFNLAVNDAPIQQVLTGIVADTPYSILLKPRSAPALPPLAPGAAAAPSLPAGGDRITMNLKDVTVFEALDAIRELHGYDYTVDGTRIYVQPPELQTRLYQVNYIVGQRRGVSDLQVVGGASGGGATNSTTSGSGATAGSASYAGIQASALSTVAKSDVWGEIEDALRTSLGCVIPRNVPGRTGGATPVVATGSAAATGGGAASAGGGSRADVSFSGEMQSGERQRGVDGCSEGRALSINPMSGNILVRGMPGELRLIEKMLRSMQVSIERQVIIEAKIIDVELNNESQQGINWAGFQRGLHRFSVGAATGSIGGAGTNGGTVSATASLGELLGNAALGTGSTGAFANGLGMAVQARNFSALINFLQTQGQVHVLSSPRIATLNNQKAVLKVGSEEPFVTSISGGGTTTSTGGTVNTPPTLNYQPFFSGIALDVTPQIDHDDQITLHVHSLVNQIVEKEKISLPTASAVLVPFAVNTINETDSVVKTRDGQVVVIGGLMTERSEDNRARVPGVGDVPAAGALFRKGSQKSSKRELVILLKPTVVRDERTWANELGAVQGRIERLRGGGPAKADEAE